MSEYIEVDKDGLEAAVQAWKWLRGGTQFLTQSEAKEQRMISDMEMTIRSYLRAVVAKQEKLEKAKIPPA